MEKYSILEYLVKFATIIGGFSALAAVCVAYKSLNKINDSIAKVFLTVGKIDNVNIYPELKEKEIINLYSTGKI